MKQIDPKRTDLAAEFKRNPLGPHGDELQKVLNIMRWSPVDGKKVLIQQAGCWCLGTLNAGHLNPIEVDETTRFNSLGDGFWHLFRVRWKEHTGEFPNID